MNNEHGTSVGALNPFGGACLPETTNYGFNSRSRVMASVGPNRSLELQDAHSTKRWVFLLEQKPAAERLLKALKEAGGCLEDHTGLVRSGWGDIL